MTVVVEAVVSTGCGKRVGAVTMMGGSSVMPESLADEEDALVLEDGVATGAVVVPEGADCAHKGALRNVARRSAEVRR